MRQGTRRAVAWRFELGLEAPDLVAAIAPVTPLPFQPTGIWQLQCHPHPGYDRISILMVAATDDPFISYGGGSSREYPAARYPRMEQALDVWVAAVLGQVPRRRSTTSPMS